ncbi:MAG TPA: ribbon-helix-helix domain-containing protein [Usitatibacteraceae bacterium]|nr:ribbon-helix-helix domain-containing protein [Usitatibacteraceae bacterium]
MCEIYCKADPILYESRTRSLRMRGVLTTIRLENLFWEVLTEMAGREGMTTNQLVAKFHDEVVAWRGESVNFASFLRVCCLRYLSVAARQEPGGPPRQAVRAAATGLRSVG